MKRSKRILEVGLLLAIVVVLAGLYRTLKPRPVQASAVEIRIDNFSFAPAALVVRKGTQITWTNRDDVPHTVVEDDKAFKSSVLDTDEKFTITTNKPGTYKYYCSIHPKMMGKVVVE
jgi:plastocyanin